MICNIVTTVLIRGGGEQRTIRTLLCGAVEVIQRRVLENKESVEQNKYVRLQRRGTVPDSLLPRSGLEECKYCTSRSDRLCLKAKGSLRNQQ